MQNTEEILYWSGYNAEMAEGQSTIIGFPSKVSCESKCVIVKRSVLEENMYMICKITTITLPLSFQSLKESCLISGVILYLNYLDEQNKRNVWLRLSFHKHWD